MPHARRSWSSILVIIISLFGFGGCDSSPEATVVDFSQTIQVTKMAQIPINKGRLRVAIGAMISPKDTFIYYRRLLDHLGESLNMEIEFVQRKTYQEINYLFEAGEVDVGLVCSGPYATSGKTMGMELLGAPQVRGRTGYQAYLIVNAQSAHRSLADLKDKVFAFTDPDSNTGYIVPLTWLKLLGHAPDAFFKDSLFTYSHDNSILAVSRNLVDGASVDGLIWEYYRVHQPALTSKTKVILKSEYFGMPPVVVRQSLPLNLKQRLAKAFFSMHNTQKGRAIMDGLMIDKFVPLNDSEYSSIRRMKAEIDG